MLSCSDLSFRLGGNQLVKKASLDFEPGKFHVIMGANGAGKSTLIRMLAGELVPTEGRIVFDGRELSKYSGAELARKRAVLSQDYHVTFPIQVRDIVLMGRYPYFRTRPGEEDIDVCRWALSKMEMGLFADRDYMTLSGGEAQKVQMSRILAQIGKETDSANKILYLDEPVSHLDVRYQFQLLQIAKEIVAGPATVIAILHDISLALSFADRIIFMKNGSIVYDLRDPSQITSQMIHEVFGIHSMIRHIDGRIMVVFEPKNIV